MEIDKNRLVSNRREQITPEQVLGAIVFTTEETNRRLSQKGYGTFASRHEILGVITEEYIELNEAVTSKSLAEIRKELADIAVACNFGISCIDANKVDW